MKNIIKILFITVIVISLSSCLGTRKSTVASNRPMNADVVRLDLKMEDFQLLGEEKLDISYRKYFELITFIDSINGTPVQRRNIKTLQFSTISPFNNLVSRAMSPLVEKYPEADFVTPIYSSVSSNGMLFGSKNKLMVKVKVYKFK
jgi:hypothetical protein